MRFWNVEKLGETDRRAQKPRVYSGRIVYNGRTADNVATGDPDHPVAVILRRIIIDTAGTGVGGRGPGQRSKWPRVFMNGKNVLEMQ